MSSSGFFSPYNFVFIRLAFLFGDENDIASWFRVSKPEEWLRKRRRWSQYFICTQLNRRWSRYCILLQLNRSIDWLQVQQTWSAFTAWLLASFLTANFTMSFCASPISRADESFEPAVSLKMKEIWDWARLSISINRSINRYSAQNQQINQSINQPLKHGQNLSHFCVDITFPASLSYTDTSKSEREIYNQFKISTPWK